jgi:signal transduction histidine kinase
MKKHSLYYKFLLGYLIFGLLGFCAISSFSSRMLQDYELAEKTEAMYDEASMIASEISRVYQGKKQDMQTAYPQLQAVAAYLQSEIWVVDRQGTIIMDSADESKAGKSIENFDPAATGSSQYCKGDYFGEFSYDVVSVSAPITGNYNTYGYVVMHLPMTVIRNSVYRKLNVYYISALVIFVLSLTILLVFTGIVYVPLMRITEGAKQYADGNLAYRIEVDTQDEMGYLAATLNYMSDELNQLEEYQRTFVANVSHDFRSPLTSIKGYLEAIIDGTIPPELQEKYLKRVIAETERLNKLTQGMLTLDSIEKKGLLNRSNFDINRVIKDTAASFEGTCMKKGITFDLTFSDNTQMVYADLGKIQQVLYNLIDNAIKFSNHDSKIYIQTYVHYEKIYVSVKDTGIGIPKSSIKKIWERFYKTDLSRGKDKKGTGLGLAIVKEIIQAHEENIDVISTEGVGTEFIFTLPKASKEG